MTMLTHSEIEFHLDFDPLVVMDQMCGRAQPIRTVDSVSFKSSIEGDAQLTTIDAPIVDAIRSGEELEIGSMEEIVVRVDGLVHHKLVIGRS